MDMDNYDGPTVAVIVRTMATMFGTSTTRMVSVHRGRADAAGALAEQILAGATTAQGLEVIEVPAPFLAEPVGQPVEIPESVVIELAMAMGWSASDVRGVPGSFARLLREVRDLHRGPGGAGPRFVRALRDALRPAQVMPGDVQNMDRTDLVHLVRSVVEAANTPGAGNTVDQRDADLAAALGMDEPQEWPTMCRKVRGLRQAEDQRDDPEALERLAHHLSEYSIPWSSLDGSVQERYLREARAALDAYWGPVA